MRWQALSPYVCKDRYHLSDFWLRSSVEVRYMSCLLLLFTPNSNPDCPSLMAPTVHVVFLLSCSPLRSHLLFHSPCSADLLLNRGIKRVNFLIIFCWENSDCLFALKMSPCSGIHEWKDSSFLTVLPHCAFMEMLLCAQVEIHKELLMPVHVRWCLLYQPGCS